MSRSSPLRSSCALVLALAAFAVCAEEAAAGPRGKAKQWWIEDASVSAGAGARPPAEVFVRGTYHALTEPAPKGFGRWKLAERLQWIEEHRWTPPSVATQTLTIEVTLSKPLGEATDLAALTEVFVNGAEVPVIEKASEDRLRISLTLPTDSSGTRAAAACGSTGPAGPSRCGSTSSPRRSPSRRTRPTRGASSPAR
jgi:hypothetical protein